MKWLQYWRHSRSNEGGREERPTYLIVEMRREAEEWCEQRRKKTEGILYPSKHWFPTTGLGTSTWPWIMCYWATQKEFYFQFKLVCMVFYFFFLKRLKYKLKCNIGMTQHQIKYILKFNVVYVIIELYVMHFDVFRYDLFCLKRVSGAKK